MQNGSRFHFDARKRADWSPCEGVNFQLVEPNRREFEELQRAMESVEDEGQRMLVFIRYTLRDESGELVIPEGGEQEFVDHVGISAFNRLVDALNTVIGAGPVNPPTASAEQPSA